MSGKKGMKKYPIGIREKLWHESALEKANGL